MATFSFLGLQNAAWTTAVAPLPKENKENESLILKEKTAFDFWK